MKSYKFAVLGLCGVVGSLFSGFCYARTSCDVSGDNLARKVVNLAVSDPNFQSDLAQVVKKEVVKESGQRFYRYTVRASGQEFQVNAHAIENDITGSIRGCYVQSLKLMSPRSSSQPQQDECDGMLKNTVVASYNKLADVDWTLSKGNDFVANWKVENGFVFTTSTSVEKLKIKRGNNVSEECVVTSLDTDTDQG